MAAQKSLARKKIQSTWVNFLNSQLHCDVEFVFEDEKGEISKIGAHKLMLSAASEVFETMFFGETVKNNAVKQENQVEIVGIRFSAFKLLLDFIYEKEVEFSDFHALVEFYGAAHKYICTDAMIFAESNMLEEVDFHNMIAFYETAALYELPDLKEKCLEIFSTKTNNILKSAEFLFVQPELVNTIFCLEKKTLDSQSDLVYALERYISVNVKSDSDIKEKVQAAANTINFSDLDSEEINRTSLLTPEAKKAKIDDANRNTGNPHGLSPRYEKHLWMTKRLKRTFLPRFCAYCLKSGRTYTHDPWSCLENISWSLEIRKIYQKYSHRFVSDYTYDDVKELYVLYRQYD